MPTVFNCPSCRSPLRVDTMGPANSSWQPTQQFALGARLPDGTSEYSRESPAGDQTNVEAAVHVPLRQALITAVAAGLVAAVITVAQGRPWTLPPIVAIAAFALAWWLLMLDSRRLLRTVETVTTDQSSNDPLSFQIEVTQHSAGAPSMKFALFPKRCRPDHVLLFAQAARDDRLTPEGASLSRRKFNAIRDIFMRRGWLEWRNPDHHSQGLQLTVAGRNVVPHIITTLLDHLTDAYSAP